MTEADLIIVATAIAVVGVIIVGVIVNAPARHDLRRKQGRPEPH
jgi:type IV secretory pathway VirB2 component (pilin)